MQLDAAEIAWVALLPCATVAVAAILLLGPALGHALFPAGSDRLWPPGWWETTGRAEPIKQGRYLLAAAAPSLLIAAILAGSRRELRLPRRMVQAITFTSYAAVVALVTVALLEQHPILGPGVPSPPVFSLRTVVVAAALVLASLVVLRRGAVVAWIARLARETRPRRSFALAFAVAFVAIWLLKAIMTDRLTGDIVGFNLPYTLNDALAVLNGRTPLVDFHVIYAKLLPYATAAVLAAFGTTVLVYTTFMAFLTGLALLAVYAVFRRITQSSLYALALFVPFVATSDLNCTPVPAGVVSPFTLTATWPMRYGGVYLLAWLTARHVDGRRPRRTWTVFFIASLVAINDLEFGLATLVAIVAALLCARPPRSVRSVLELAASFAAGALGAIVVVAVITLARSGELPSPAVLLEWPRIFTTLGWFSLPLATWDLHLAIYATFVAAVVAAVVRASRRDDGVLLTAMLAWSGVFGLLAGGYFIGRPDALKLEGILSAWSFALAPLTIACVRALAARSWRRPTLPQLLVLFGFGLSLCTISRLSLPQKQIARLTKTQPDPVYRASAEGFVDEHTRRGEKVAILVPMSYGIAQDLGLTNVAPYGMMNVIVTRPQMQTLIDAVRSENVRTIFTPAPGSQLAQEGDADPRQFKLLLAIGFKEASSGPGIVEFRRT